MRAFAVKLFLLLILLSSLEASSQENKTSKNKTNSASRSVEALKEDIKKIENSIEVTKNKIKTSVEITFLPDLYFVLAELILDKSRIMTVLKKESNPNTPNSELDFTNEKRVQAEGIENFKIIEERYPNYVNLDKVLFAMAQEYLGMGNNNEALKVYKNLVSKFPASSYGLKAQFEIGNIFFDKRDFEFAMEQYQKLITMAPGTEEFYRATYKLGWCQSYMGNFLRSFDTFESIIDPKGERLGWLVESSESSEFVEESLIAMIWPYSELNPAEITLKAELSNPLQYFEKRTPDKSAYRRFLTRFGQRMEIKERHKEASDAYLELFRLSDDLTEKKNALEKYYSSMKKINIDLLPLWFSKEVSQILKALSDEARLKKSVKFDIKPYEPILRDVATRTHKMGLKTKRKEDLLAAAEAYDNYLWVFPKSKWTAIMMLNMAESYFHAEEFVKAGLLYYRLGVHKANFKKMSKKSLLESSIEAFTEALKRSDKLTNLENLQGREGFRAVSEFYVKKYPGSKNNPNIHFNFAKSLYDEQKFQEAIDAFRKFLNDNPRHKLAPQAVAVLLDCYYIRNDIESLLKEGKSLLKNKRLPPTVKSELKQIMQQAQLKGVQSIAGDFTSKKYSQQFLAFANQHKGSAIGEKALLEAFSSLKASHDLKAYTVGEQYLGQYPTGAQAKDILNSMIQMALATVDYVRVAKYMTVYGATFTNEPVSQDYLLQSAQINEQIGELDKAAESYSLLGRHQDEARMYMLARKWKSLIQVASRISGLEGRYYQGLALYRGGKKQDGLLMLRRVLEEEASSPLSREMATHAGIIVSEHDIKSFESMGARKTFSVELLKQKMESLREIDSRLQMGISRGAGSWVVANFYLLGKLSQNFSIYLSKVKIPNELKSAQFVQTLQQQSKMYSQAATTHFRNCIKTAEDNDVFTNYVKACRSAGKINLSESQEVTPRLKAGKSDTEVIIKIRKNLVQTPRSQNLLNEYVVALLKEKNYAEAAVVVRRKIEIEPEQAENYAMLGVVNMFMNQFDESVVSFKEALQRETLNATALYGMFGLYKNFEFKNKSAQLMPLLKQASKPKTIIHPWMKQWK